MRSRRTMPLSRSRYGVTRSTVSIRAAPPRGAVGYELNPKDRDRNVRPRRSLCFNARGNIIVSPKKFVAAVGVQNLAIIDTEDALLVCALNRSQDVGKAVQEMERLKLRELL